MTDKIKCDRCGLETDPKYYGHVCTNPEPPAPENIENPNIFPETFKVGEIETTQGGATLRDYFAGEALKGWLSNSEATKDVLKDDFICSTPAGAREWIAHTCYQFADAMLKVRSQ